jgi:type 1 glutamine amidotransferase
MKKLLLFAAPLACITPASSWGQTAVGPIPLTPEWSAKIQEAAPEKAPATPEQPRKILLFSLMTGFQHWVTPHTAEVVRILGDKTGAYEVVESQDIEIFTPERLREFDAVVLNNSCSDRKHRHLFLDVLEDNVADPSFSDRGRYVDLSEAERREKAAALEQNLIDYVAHGGGLAMLHGALTTFNESENFSRMAGGSFHFHPRQQAVHLEVVEPGHPLVAGFGSETFSHWDEPYIYNGDYPNKNFRPLLRMNSRNLPNDARIQADTWYAAWIKPHEAGRVFYMSPSHNAQSFEDPRLLHFMLSGIQYAAGDLKADDQPLAE